ncbi:MAG: phenylacetate--CoA ligase family protein [Burkholderiales bacterium]|nr:phenylacetate--CoA ligase family protein [Burkholderiales bacterium]
MSPHQGSPAGWSRAPRTNVPGARWPGVLTGRAASLAAMQALFDRSQWLDPAELEALQFRQLEELIGYAARHVPFYRERLAAAGIEAGTALDRGAWARIPVLERAELQSEGARLRSGGVPESHGRIAESGTSGSTGRKVIVARTELDDFYHQALTLRAGSWGGWDPRGATAAIRSYEGGYAEPPDGLRRADWGAPWAELCETGPSYVLNCSASVSQQVDWLGRVQPDYLTIYPSLLPELIAAARRRGVRLARLKQVRTIGECLDPAVRELCGAHWGVTIQDTYSAQDAGYLALQCPARDHHHVQSEGVLLEVLDERGEPCRAGEAGRVVVTPLHNFAMPLVRYAVGDYAEVGPSCPCGRGLPVIARVLGRARNLLLLPNGERLWPRLGRIAFREELEVRQFQMLQTGRTTLELRLVSPRRGTPEEEARVAAMIAEGMGYPFDVKYVYVEEIPRGPGGKYEDFKSEIGG